GSGDSQGRTSRCRWSNGMELEPDQQLQMSGGTRAATSRRRDDGFTLVEAVIAIALMAIVVVPVLTAVMASIEASSRARSAAQIGTVSVSAADRVTRAPKTAGDLADAQAAVRSQKWDTELAWVGQEHYAPAAAPRQPGEWLDGPCLIDTPTE